MTEGSRISKQLDQIDDMCQEVLDPQQDLFKSEYIERSWLKSHGKEQLIPFSDKALIQLHRYFNSLDDKGNGSLGVQELEDPFIAFGLTDTREQVLKLIDSVDTDGSGKIEFNEFLQIMLKIKRGKSASKNSAMYDFFHRMSTGQLGEDFDKDMSFKLNVSQFRRKKLLESIMSNEKEKKQKGTKIMQNFKKQVLNNPYLKQTLNQSKKKTGSVSGLDPKKIFKMN